MTNLKLAVIGAGHLGRIHAKLIGQIPHVELVGVADPVAAARDQVAADCHTTPYADHRKLIGKVDGAIIAVPTIYHHAVALDFLRQGTPLLIEKPLAADSTQANELVETAARHGATVQVGHIERFNPAFVAARDQVGPPRYVEAVRASTYTGRSTDIGAVNDLMIHDIDLLLTLVDAPLVSVQALGFALLGRHEDVAQARFEFANGCVANLSASRVSFTPVPRRQMHIWGEQGFVAIDFGARAANVVSPCDAVLDRTYDYEALPAEEKAAFKDKLFTEILHVEPLEIQQCNALLDELHDFVGSVREHRQPRVTGAQGRKAVAAAEAVLESIRQHKWHGSTTGPVGPQAVPAPSILRGPHWQRVHEPARPPSTRREAG